MKVDYSEYITNNKFNWCTGCGNYSVWGALRLALVEDQISPKDVLFVHDIGCNGNGADKIGGYGFKGLHGRSAAFGAGASIANGKVKVIASSGDGAVLAEGIGHLIHGIRSNYNMIYLIHNNSNFALTTGQASPSTSEGIPMNSSPDGVTAEPMNIMNFILPLEPSFAARVFTGEQKQMVDVLRQALNHKGFSVIEIMQYCPSYNHLNTNDWYLERVYDLASDKKYDVTDLDKAKKVAFDLEKKIATGVIYKDPKAVDFMGKQVNRKNYKSELVDEVKVLDVCDLLKAFM